MESIVKEYDSETNEAIQRQSRKRGIFSKFIARLWWLTGDDNKNCESI